MPSARLLNAADRHEIVFTRNSTEAINLVAHSYGRGMLKPGQAVLISEHGAPLQHRALADAARRAWHRAARRADHRCGRARHGGARGAARGWPRRPGRHHPYVERARHLHAGRAHRRDSRTRTARKCCSTARRRWCIAASTCRRWTPISTSSPATSSTARPASACCGRGANCWRRCRRSWAAAT